MVIFNCLAVKENRSNFYVRFLSLVSFDAKEKMYEFNPCQEQAPDRMLSYKSASDFSFDGKDTDLQC